MLLVEQFHEQRPDDGRDDDAYEAWPHEAVVQQVLADDGGARTVEVYGGDVGGVIRDEEVPVHAREYAQKHGALDAEAVGERDHGDHDRTLRVDEYAHREEREGNGPRVVLHNILETALHHVHVVRKVGVGEPRDSVDGDDGDHAALPHGACDGLLGACLAEDNHERCCRNHHNLDDDVHGERLYLRHAVNDFAGRELRADVVADNLEDGEQHDDCEGAEEDEHGALRFFRDFLVEHGGGAPVHVFLCLRVLEARLESGILVEVKPAFVRDERCRHDAAEASGNRNRDDLQVVHIESVRVRDDDERGDGCGDGRAGDAYLRCDGSDTAGAFRADSLLERDVADDGHEGVDHVTRTYQHGEEERAKRGEERDVARVPAQKPFRKLDKPIHAARCLHDARTCDCRYDDVDDVGGRGARLESESEHQEGKADSRNRAEGEASVSGAHVEREQYN